MPKRFKKKGMSKMQNVSLICDKEIKTLACSTNHCPLKAGFAPKLLMKGLANPLVICKLTPRNMEKRKNKAMRLWRKSLKASSPMVSTRPFRS